MLSGVGPSDLLEKCNIPVVKNLPGVGKHLMDHAVVLMNFRLSLGESLMYIEPRSIFEGVRMVPKLLQWLILGTGPLTSNVSQLLLFERKKNTYIMASPLR